MFKITTKNRYAFIVFVTVLLCGIIVFGMRHKQKQKHIPLKIKSALAQIIPGVTSANDVARLFGKGEHSEEAPEWVRYNSAYVHYDEKSNRVNALHLEMEPSGFTGMDIKIIYSLDDVSPDTMLKNNRAISIYKLDEKRLLAVTYEGPTEETAVYSLSFLTKDALDKGVLSKLPGSNFDINGEWIVEDASGNYSVYISQDGESFSGTYGYSGGILYGTIKGREAQFTWKQNVNKVGGQAQFTLSEDGKTFSGAWQYDPNIYNSGRTGEGTWTFRRNE